MSKLNFEKLKIEIFGASHESRISAIVSGIPKGLKVDFDYITKQLERRQGGKAFTTDRKEPDVPVFESGIDGDATNGEDVRFYIKNVAFDSTPYVDRGFVLRPSHADYPAVEKYGRMPEGGGSFSGRLTALLVVAGGLFKTFLTDKGVTVTAHVSSVGEFADEPFDNVSNETYAWLKSADFPVLNGQIKQKCLDLIKKTKADGDSIGGSVECKITGLPVGLGGEWFNSSESMLSTLLFAIPAVKAVEFGKGHDISTLFGSEANDPYTLKNGKIVTEKNDNGGILGGLTTGMPVVFKTFFKPTPSIAKEQNTVDYQTKTPCKLAISGKHDACIVARVAPVVEAVAEIWAAELFLED